MRVSGTKRFWTGVLAGVLMVTMSLAPASTVMALSDAMLDFFAANGIYYYDPSGTQCVNYNTGGGAGGGTISGGDAMKQAVLRYGQFAMDLQRKYGTPWEVVFAQMVLESNVGQCTNCVASGVAAMGYYNWLGITGSGGSLGTGNPYYSPSGRQWATFASVENMMEAWAGPYVLRNGYYDAAFVHLDPNNYNLNGFISTMIPVYAPPSENDTTGYISRVIGLVADVQRIAAEQGWPTSAELAKQENIQVGGETAIGGTVPSTGSTYADACAQSLQYGNVVSYILAYAWPEYHSAPYTQKTTAYEEAVKKRQSEGKYVGGANGIDCGGFVTTVMQESGFEPNYNDGQGNTYAQEQWVQNHGWSRVSDISQLVPGDVAFTDGHTFVYVGQQPGFETTIASASAPGDDGSDARAPMAGKETIGTARWYHKN